MSCGLAIDIGASGGRHILGEIRDGRLVTKEIYRFENGMKNVGGSLVWDVGELFENVLEGLRRCAAAGTVPSTVAVDTWGVDYVLLDGEGRAVLPAYAYRDGGTAAADIPAEIEKILGPGVLYRRTGIQSQPFNTVYQLRLRREAANRAGRLLMMPEYLSYMLTGKACSEYTNATTTGLVNAETGDWDRDMAESLGINAGILGPIVHPPAELGRFRPEVARLLGYNSLVLMCPSHDTASAVAACPLEDGGVFISSGTWSLVGAETERPIISEAARRANFTNEGGIDRRYRFLKNIMGMWLFQGIRKSLDKKYSYDEMMYIAMESGFEQIFDPNHPSLAAPADMLGSIRALLDRPGLPVADVLGSVYHSLAASYAKTVGEIEALTGRRCTGITVMGGGSRDAYLNSLTKKVSGKRVFVGPTEATAAGNLLSQFMYAEGFSLGEGREIIKKSFDIREVE